MDASGNLVWEYHWGYNWVWDVFIDKADYVYVVGESDDGMIIRKHWTDGATIWKITWVVTDSTTIEGIVVDDLGHVYIAGYFWGTQDFDPGPGEDWHTSNGSRDGFLTKFNPMGTHEWTLTWGGSSGDECVDLGYDSTGYILVTGYYVGTAVDSNGNAFTTGHFRELVDFNPGPGSDYHNSPNGDVAAYLSMTPSDGNWW